MFSVISHFRCFTFTLHYSLTAGCSLAFLLLHAVHSPCVLALHLEVTLKKALQKEMSVWTECAPQLLHQLSADTNTLMLTINEISNPPSLTYEHLDHLNKQLQAINKMFHALPQKTVSVNAKKGQLVLHLSLLNQCFKDLNWTPLSHFSWPVYHDNGGY
jgi:hypothetical protein